MLQDQILNTFKINFKKYFKKEIEAFGEFIKDRLVVLSNDGIKITGLGTNFSPQIANVFDKYDPPSVSYNERLQRINKVTVHPS